MVRYTVHSTLVCYLVEHDLTIDIHTKTLVGLSVTHPKVDSEPALKRFNQATDNASVHVCMKIQLPSWRRQQRVGIYQFPGRR